MGMLSRLMPKSRIQPEWITKTTLRVALAMSAHDIDPLSEADAMQLFYTPHVNGLLFCLNNNPVAYAIYIRDSYGITIKRFCTTPAYRGYGYSKECMADLQSRVTKGEGKRIRFDVDEENLQGQLFLRACGFRCTSTHSVNGDCKYRFRWEAQ